jgi:hypothetical protein
MLANLTRLNYRQMLGMGTVRNSYLESKERAEVLKKALNANSISYTPHVMFVVNLDLNLKTLIVVD